MGRSSWGYREAAWWLPVRGCALSAARLPGLPGRGLHPSAQEWVGLAEPPAAPRAQRPCSAAAWPPSLRAVLSTLLELSAYGLLLYWSVQCFGLEINWEKRLLDSKVGTSRPCPRGLPAPCPHGPAPGPLRSPCRRGSLGQERLLADPVAFPSVQPSPITSSRHGCGQ